jgi:cytochrome c oxidase subunit 1
LASRAFSPGHSSDNWTIALLASGFGSIATAINIIATIISMRCPGMTLSRMPLLAWLNLVMSGMVLLAISPLSAAQIMLLVGRHLGGHFFDTQAGGSATLWMHFFWIFGHPEVYVLIIPCFAFASEIIPVFSRKPIFEYPVMVGGIVGIYLSVPLVAALRVIYRRFASPPVGATVPGNIVDSPEPRGETSVMA